MEKLVIQGNATLKGDVTISGAKNAALPILAATLLTDGVCEISNVPTGLRDIRTMIRLLESLGKKIEIKGEHVIISADGPTKHIAHYDLVSTMRGSFCVLGPLLSKLRKAKVSLPGGCVIGLRPVDLHIKGLEALGVTIDVDAGYIIADAKNLKGASVYLGGMFGSSVLATANIMMAAVLAQGTTIIEQAACEPEIEDLANFLKALGADIRGEGSPHITIKGVKKLSGCKYDIIPDRIEAGTFALMAVATRSDIVLKKANYQHLFCLFDLLRQVGVNVTSTKNTIQIEAKGKLTPIGMTTYPYPGFPTDLQAQYMATMATIPGVSVITEKVFPDRFMHIAELGRMGARIRREGSTSIIEGIKLLKAAPVMASDLRASAALVIAGLAAKGVTEVKRIYHLQRGYQDLDVKLAALGAEVKLEDE